LKIGWFHIGADIENSVPTQGLPDDASQILARLSARPSFLMVGTVEPRKGYLQAIAAFEQLWNNGVDANLVIVGKEGWKDLPNDLRRTIPEIVNRLRHHPELDCRLFWLEGISDEYLEKIYIVSTCLIAASEGEGFGLPLIEAAQHKLPIIARDIPVFREVAGNHAFYFSGKEPADLADSIRGWLALCRSGKHPRSYGMAWLRWNESAERLLYIILNNRWYTEWKWNDDKKE
jgi:glycosyltransferase involved in cell wall biosynthesis